jgi:hypothetical protein
LTIIIHIDIWEKPGNTGTNLAQQMCLENKTNSLKVVRRKTQRKEAWNEKNQIKRRDGPLS